MKVRRVKALAELPDAQFLTAIAQGAERCLQNAERLYQDAQSALESGAHRGYLVLRGIAEEEASKTLILVDAARCPTAEQEKRSGQLGKFYDHHSRLIYSEICGYKPADFQELEGLVEQAREEYYLDGPTGFDWIYRNRLLQWREGTLYVDYVDGDDGRRWEHPNDELVRMMTIGGPLQPHSLAMARDLKVVGILTGVGIRIVAEVWRDFRPNPDTRWATLRSSNHQTLERLKQVGVGIATELAGCAERLAIPAMGP